MTIYYLPIEPLPERYTESWYRNFPVAFNTICDVVTIDGETLTDHVETGTFLDINSTSYYKSSQLQKIARLFYEKKINDGDIFFVADIEFWGIESIKILAQLQNIHIKLVGFCHAASYTIEDFMEPTAPYHQYIEVAWFNVFDLIFVGSHYHKQQIIQKRLVPIMTDLNAMGEIIKKIIVTGNPMFYEDYAEIHQLHCTKKKQIILSNRFDWEKRPNISLDFAYIIKKSFPDINIIVTTSRPTFKSNRQWLVNYARILEQEGIIKIYENCSKNEYHQHLAESRIFLSNTIEENFGYCLVEAIHFNTYPVVPFKFSHSEILCHNDMFLFQHEDEIIDKILNLMYYNHDISSYAETYFIDSMKTMLRHMQSI